MEVAQTGGLEVGEVEPSYGVGDMTQGVGTTVAVGGGVGGGARATGVDHDDHGAPELHGPPSERISQYGAIDGWGAGTGG